LEPATAKAPQPAQPSQPLTAAEHSETSAAASAVDSAKSSGANTAAEFDDSRQVSTSADGGVSMIGKAYSDAAPALERVTDTPEPESPNPPTTAPASEDAEVLALYQRAAEPQGTSSQKDSAGQSNKTTQTSEPPSPYAELGGVRSLPLAAQNAVPTLMYATHSYDPAGDSSVVINGRIRRAGDTLTAGIELESIEAEGIIVRMGEHRFTLKALSSWVNM
ncbi:general secretion pathway protein GspB, partial [Gilvimarinus agarilyticus]|uniref:general secretion pathway protein GspB n=1 Tax=Gilvimarinus sp. 2_MG-2023 TaxID=3062666 RepID=UPI001C0A3B00